MKSISILATAALLLAIPIFLWSEEGGAALYDTNCAACHGAKGEGNPDAEMPKVSGTAMTVQEISDYITKGAEGKTIHAAPIGDFDETQAKAISEYVKSLKE
jgi:mono/diheme cytochrome c family protein